MAALHSRKQLLTFTGGGRISPNMGHAFLFAWRQLGHPRIWGVIAKVIVLTLALFVLFGIALWRGLYHWGGSWTRGAYGDVGAFLAVLATLALAWFLFRAVAMLVMGIFSDEVVDSVEARYFPLAAQRARTVGLRQGAALGFASARRALGYNLLALPLYIGLLVTGAGMIVALVLVNALLLGRDLQDMVMARHQHDTAIAALAPATRMGLGLVVALLFLVPIVNLLAPVIGAAMAVYLVHSRHEVKK